MKLAETGIHLGQIEKADLFHWPHLLAWIGGILCALVPFIGAWEIGPMQVPVRFGSGNFGTNILIGTALCMVGGMVGGYWWRFNQWLARKNHDWGVKSAAVVLFLLGIFGCCFEFLHPPFFPLVGVVLVAGVVAAWWSRKKYPPQRPQSRLSILDLLAWLKRRNAWNAVFFLLLLVVLIINNLTLAWGLDISAGAKFQVLLGRILTQGLLVGTVFLLTELTMRASPKYFRWSPWLAISLFPLLVIADQLIGMMWSRPLINVVNVMTQSGSFKPEVELAASGLDVGPMGARLIVLGVLLFAGMIAGGCWLVSKRFNIRISMRTAMGITLVCWLGVVAEQGLGAIWQNVADRQVEHKAFKLNVGLFSPPEGMGSYRVTFFSGEADFHGVIPELENKPDVFVFMLESTRADAIRPDVAPFLSEFRDTECQPLGATWSGSNATHLSWFSFFHSRVPVFWREALEAIPDRDSFAGSVPLQQLKQAGYEIEVRAVCDLSYKDFGLSNFGSGTNLATVLVQADDANRPFSDYNIAERERLCFEYVRNAVLARPSGGGFYYTALDSPHYNYYWHKDFTPPFSEYDEDTRFPLNPTKDEVQRVVNRYWNAVAWADSQIAQFCEFLKSEGRYDESIIIVTGDHGEEFQEQGSWFHCSSIQPEQTGVPLLIKWPKSIGRGPTQTAASHLDVMPSLMSVLGMPSETIRGMAGRNLLVNDGERTAISTTAYPGKSGETMVLRRGDYEATFSWGQYWEAPVPEEMVLERLTGPDGEISLADAKAYDAELRRVFPDAFERFFKSFEVIE